MLTLPPSPSQLAVIRLWKKQNRSLLERVWNFCSVSNCIPDKSLVVVLFLNLFLSFSLCFYFLGKILCISSVAQSCPTLCDPMNRSTPGLLVHHQLLESTQIHAHWVGDVIQPSYPLSSPSPPALNLSQHQGLFKWVSSSHQVAKVLEFQQYAVLFKIFSRSKLECSDFHVV